MTNKVKMKITMRIANCNKLRRMLFWVLFGMATVVEGQNLEFTQQTGADNPLNEAEVGSGTTSITVDIDNDGDYDFFVGNLEGGIQYYKNVGTAEAPNVFEEQVGANNPFDGVDVGTRATIVFVDIDNNGTLDAFIACTNSILYFKNTGTLSQPVFQEQLGQANPLAAVTHNMDRSYTLSFADIDLDADLDVFVGWVDYNTDDSSGIDYYKNIGTNSVPQFEQQLGEDNPFESFNQLYPTPIFIDLDEDADMDVFIGTGDGTFLYFENTTDYSNLNTTELENEIFTMYPNPTHSLLNFSIQTEAATIKVISLSGMELLRGTITKQKTFIEVGDLSQGIYLVVFDDGIHKMTKKLVIAK